MPGVTATATKPWGADKTRTYAGQSVPILKRAAGNGVAKWLQALYGFCDGLKPPTTDAPEKLIVNVCFHTGTAETDSVCKKAMATILSLALSDEYYTRVMDDTLCADTKQAGAIITLANNMQVCTIDPIVVFERATKLADIAVSGVTLDDILQEPAEHFTLTNPEYATNATFVGTVDDIVEWYRDYYHRLKQAGGGAVTEATRCTHLRTALRHVCSELNVDKLLDYDKLGGSDGMVTYLTRLARKRDGEGAKPERSLVVPHVPKYQNKGAKGKHRKGSTEKNPRGARCHQCDSEYHYIADCTQVPKASRREATFLADEGRYKAHFWKKSEKPRRKKPEPQLFQADGFGGYEPYDGGP